MDGDIVILESQAEYNDAVLTISQGGERSLSCDAIDHRLLTEILQLLILVEA